MNHEKLIAALRGEDGDLFAKEAADVIEQQFSALDMASARAEGFRDGVASVAVPTVKESLSVAAPSAPAAEPAPVEALSGGVRVPRELLERIQVELDSYHSRDLIGEEGCDTELRALLAAQAEQGGGV